jgi:hypothetical protein
MIAAVVRTTAEARGSAKQDEPADCGTHDYIMAAYDGLHTADNELSFNMNVATLIKHAALLPGDWLAEIAEAVVARPWAARGEKGPSRRRSQAWLEEIEWRYFHSRMGERLPPREDDIADIMKHSVTHRGVYIGRDAAGDIYDKAKKSYATRDYAVHYISVR